MALPLLPLLLGKLALAGGITLAGHRLVRGFETPAHYAQKTPIFVPQQHLAGAFLVEGVVHGPTGRVTSPVHGSLIGHWDENTGHLQDHMMFEQSTLSRVWRFDINGTTVTATSNDGTKAKGTLSGNTLHLSYTLTLPKSHGGHTVTASEWYYLLESGTIINRTLLKKFGFPVGEISTTIKRQA